MSTSPNEGYRKTESECKALDHLQQERSATSIVGCEAKLKTPPTLVNGLRQKPQVSLPQPLYNITYKLLLVKPFRTLG